MSHYPVARRLWRRYLRTRDTLTPEDVELLELITGICRSAEPARAVYDFVEGDLARLLRLDVDALEACEGLTTASRLSLAHAVELARRARALGTERGGERAAA